MVAGTCYILPQADVKSFATVVMFLPLISCSPRSGLARRSVHDCSTWLYCRCRAALALDIVWRVQGTSSSSEQGTGTAVHGVQEHPDRQSGGSRVDDVIQQASLDAWEAIDRALLIGAPPDLMQSLLDAASMLETGRSARQHAGASVNVLPSSCLR